MNQRWIVLLFLFILVGCAAAPSTRPSDVLSCAEPEGYEYTCYDDKGCIEYMKGYSGVVRQRFRMQEHHGWYPGVTVHVVPIHLFLYHRSTYWIGRIEAERIDGKIFQRIWFMSCDIEYNILEEAYSEGFQGGKMEEVTEWPKE